jgi:putative nucleotidyltransferase with HDIG domain
MIKPFPINKLKILYGGIAILLFLLSNLLQVSLIVPVFLITIFVYLKFSKESKAYNTLHIALLFVIIFVLSYYTIRQQWPNIYIPFCAIPMLSIILTNQLEISLLLTLTSAISVAAIFGNNLYLGIFFLTSGIISIVLAKGVRRRSQIIRAGVIVGLVQAVILFILERFNILYVGRYSGAILNGIFSSVIVLGVLPVFEYLFKTVTNISLLELADFNNPILQRLILEAPGTYHHSLIVGNLSEAACGAVGANSLLARIGAYYHDIGKLQKPDYFSENQEVKQSKHDVLSPAMSKLVIMNHVKEGADLARRYKLSPPLIEFILRHHGDSLVYYFYRRAVEELEDDQEVKEEGYRYPGPKPNTKETAIVLLADSVEAATRALRDPTPTKIEEVVHKIINNKFIDGQLDECDLTLSDLEKISAVFVRILSGIYHSRTTYPEESRSENNNKKSSKENSHQSSEDARDKKSSP